MANRREITVRLRINGPETILNGRVNVETVLSRTWAELLNGELRLRLQPRVRITTSQFRRGNSRRGWSAGLNEEIRSFINRFPGRRNMYNIYLYMPRGARQRQAGNGIAGIRNAGNIRQPNFLDVTQVNLRRFNENFLRSVRREIRELRQDGLWIRNVMDAPRCLYLVEELFRGT